MGREVRRVPADWQHPKDERGEYIPLRSGDLAARQAEWDMHAAKWAEGLRSDFQGGWIPIDDEHRNKPYESWDGERPREEEYMPQWPAEQCTHYQMYQNTSEGTPISPVFAEPEALARWLANTGASAFGRMTASYDEWLATIREGRAMSAVATFDPDGGGSLKSGVAANKPT